MIAPTKLARFDARVRSFLAKHFKNRPPSLIELTGLWETYARLGLPDDFVAEFTNGKPASLAQRTWALSLAQHLHDQGHVLTCVGNGPDLYFEHGGKRIWVEAVCPEPKGLPADWLEEPKPGEGKVGTFPHEQLLLRWTTAFDAKASKLKKYLEKGTALPSDAYIIAINGCQLGWTPGARGITQMPLAWRPSFRWARCNTNSTARPRKSKARQSRSVLSSSIRTGGPSRRRRLLTRLMLVYPR
jgi:hypothetical protein